MNKPKTKTIVPNRNSFYDQFKDHGTQLSDHHLIESCKLDIGMFKMALWCAWLKEAFDGTDGVDEQDLDNMTYKFFDVQQKIEKVMEFAELATYATGFEIPEDKTFRYIDIEALAGKEA